MEMPRRKFSREFKIEAVRLIKERGVSVAQAGRDLDVHENVLRKWMRELVAATDCALTYGLELSPPPLPSPDFEVSLAWHARADADPAHIWFRDLVAELVHDLR
jgi:DNA-binding transcriptional LysR family regulator